MIITQFTALISFARGMELAPTPPTVKTVLIAQDARPQFRSPSPFLNTLLTAISALTVKDALKPIKAGLDSIPVKVSTDKASMDKTNSQEALEEVFSFSENLLPKLMMKKKSDYVINSRYFILI